MNRSRKQTQPALEDLDAIDGMLTAARDHAAAVADATAPGSPLRSRALQLIRDIEKASTGCTWLSIDVAQLQRIPATAARPSFTESANEKSEPGSTAAAA